MAISSQQEITQRAAGPKVVLDDLHGQDPGIQGTRQPPAVLPAPFRPGPVHPGARARIRISQSNQTPGKGFPGRRAGSPRGPPPRRPLSTRSWSIRQRCVSSSSALRYSGTEMQYVPPLPSIASRFGSEYRTFVLPGSDAKATTIQNTYLQRGPVHATTYRKLCPSCIKYGMFQRCLRGVLLPSVDKEVDCSPGCGRLDGGTVPCSLCPTRLDTLVYNNIASRLVVE
ncbi:hypothetical protein Purlil1_6043 [Purpureocillium lilacinum]|uniref:Uncharacterized protein n=1 Tax=Purpureocillium lilacinum TaxID=33203 RepID=A0ABR0BZF0_PURLI|nr:hypothetical protein Purlil1_6043 [Purpureocillium lilacinum]